MNEEQRADGILLNGISILLVEDSDMNRLVAATMLHNHGATVYEAVHGLHALGAMEKISCDLVLMDIQMPVMDGRKATRIIRKRYETKMPIIALTANAAKKETDKCLAAGMNDCIAKPFEEEDLIKLILKWVGKDLQPACVTGGEKPLYGGEKPLYSLEKLYYTGRGDPDFVQRMIQLFIVQIPAGIREIKTAYVAGNFSGVEATAHRMEPILNNFCISVLKEEIGEMQFLAGKRRPSPRLEELIGNMDIITTQIVEDLKNLKSC
jgi:CheY-like chemotaxis protein